MGRPAASMSNHLLLLKEKDSYKFIGMLSSVPSTKEGREERREEGRDTQLLAWSLSLSVGSFVTFSALFVTFSALSLLELSRSSSHVGKEHQEHTGCVF